MTLIGYVARYPDGSYAHPYGERGSIKLYLKEGVAWRNNRKAKIVPVYAHDAPPEPTTYCRSCGRPKDDHPVRHPFVPA